MKHLRHYNEFIFKDPISKKDIEEICYDITDDNQFNIRIIQQNSYSAAIYINKLNKYKENHSINFILTDEVMDVILRLVDYIGNKLNHITISYAENGFNARGRSVDYQNNKFMSHNGLFKKGIEDIKIGAECGMIFIYMDVKLD